MPDETGFEAVGRRGGQAFNAVFAGEIRLMAGAFATGSRAAVNVGITGGGVGGEGLGKQGFDGVQGSEGTG